MLLQNITYAAFFFDVIRGHSNQLDKKIAPIKNCLFILSFHISSSCVSEYEERKKIYYDFIIECNGYVSYSPDPIKNSKTTNPNCHEFFDQLKQIWQVWFVYLLLIFSSKLFWLVKTFREISKFVVSKLVVGSSEQDDSYVSSNIVYYPE